LKLAGRDSKLESSMQSKPTKLAVVATQIALAGTAAAVALMAGSAVCRSNQA
jgi:hypothetical protein